MSGRTGVSLPWRRILVVLCLAAFGIPQVAGAMSETTEVEFSVSRTRAIISVNGQRLRAYDDVAEARAHAAELEQSSPDDRIVLRTVIVEQVTLVDSEPAPTPEPEPIPEPDPDPAPAPDPDPAPAPEPTPDPVPAPEPDPVPEPDPTPQPDPEPTPNPIPTPEPEPDPIPAPDPIPEPDPEPWPGFVEGQDATPPTSGRSKPAVGRTIADPAYGLDVTRLTSADGTRFNRNTYSRRQAENADGTRILTYHGDAEYRVYDSASGSEIAITGLHPDAEPQWHPTDPGKLRHITGPNSYVGTLTLRETDIRTGQETVIANLTERVQQTLPGAAYLSDGAEGSSSADGNRYAWMVFDGNEDLIGTVAYDLAADRILGITDDLPTDRGLLDAISMSPSGQFVVAQWWEATLQYEVDFSGEHLILPGAEHSDIAIGANGNDTYVYIDFTNSERAGWVVAYDMVTGQYRKLINLYDNANTSIHISGKAYDQPGWAVLSTYSCKVPGAWTCHKTMALNLESGKVLNLAHTYNCGENYWTETHAVANRDLSRVYFNSDFGSCGSDAEVYRIDVPVLPNPAQAARTLD